MYRLSVYHIKLLAKSFPQRFGLRKQRFWLSRVSLSEQFCLWLSAGLGRKEEACDARLPCGSVSPLNAEVALTFLIWALVCSYFLTFLQKGVDWGRAQKHFLSHPYLVLSDKSSGQQRAS